MIICNGYMLANNCHNLNIIKAIIRDTGLYSQIHIFYAKGALKYYISDAEGGGLTSIAYVAYTFINQSINLFVFVYFKTKCINVFQTLDTGKIVNN